MKLFSRVTKALIFGSIPRLGLKPGVGSILGFGLILGLGFTSTPALSAGLLVPSNASSASDLQIKSHDVSVVVEDGYAITEVNQVFHNPEANDLEATYRFPVPDKAAVSEFTVWIDNQPVIGEVLEKKEARKVYEEEKAAGREAGLASKNKHYNFEIKVTPVRAGQDTRIRLVYMQGVDISIPVSDAMFIRWRTAAPTMPQTRSG